jgi:hypothetical protein
VNGAGRHTEVTPYDYIVHDYTLHIHLGARIRRAKLPGPKRFRRLSKRTLTCPFISIRVSSVSLALPQCEKRAKATRYKCKSTAAPHVECSRHERIHEEGEEEGEG